MAIITLKGIRLETLSLERQDRTGKIEMKSASYSLLSSTNHVRYSDKVAITPSKATLDLLDQFIESYKKDITVVLGLEEA